jgi:UDP-N-acetylmuramoyl-L-alanyl-D-glutamate--2,6-diaminopimelate ligase
VNKPLNPEMEISSIEFDSRNCKPGSLFVAVKGTQVDGHNYISQAVKNGSTAVICENIPESNFEDIDFLQVKNSAKALGQAASNFYNHPSKELKLIGVTGTNGKTTIVNLLFEIVRKMGYKAGMLSTIENKIENSTIGSTHTTPDPVQINKLMAQMVDEGCTYCFMEVSSHSIDQERIAGLHFTGAIFTNITHDHLDYHKIFDAYIKAKKQFFDALDANAFAHTNIDDKNGMVMLQNTFAAKYSYALKKPAYFKARIIENQFEGLQLNIDGNDLWSKLVGEFNAYNILAVYAVMILSGEDKEEVLTALSMLNVVEGRFDYIRSNKNIIGIIDYAHTPDAVKKVLETINSIRTRNETLITIVGAGGDRDKAKRGPMGQIAARLSDKVIITSDNPRSEEPAAIIEQIEKGVEPMYTAKCLSISDRKEAIKTACMLANPNDIILVAGKGHEKYQEIKGIKHPFDDKEILKEYLAISGMTMERN